MAAVWKTAVLLGPARLPAKRADRLSLCAASVLLLLENIGALAHN